MTDLAILYEHPQWFVPCSPHYALAVEDKGSPYVNFVVGRADAARDPRAQKRVHALRSAQTRAFIETMYKGAVLPAS